jgi:hypothetical protein
LKCPSSQVTHHRSIGTITTGSRAGVYTTNLPVTTTTNSYVPVPTTTYPATYGTGSSVVYGATSGYVTGGSTYGVTSAYNTRTAVEEIPVESRIEYIPFEKKYIEYDRI